ncbi:MAG: hypothetical protein ACRDJW_20440 [Thermomicrobiales bacterium]
MYGRWPLDLSEIPGGTIVSQRLPNGAGYVFVRSGPGQTIEMLRAFMADLHTTVTTVEETATTLAGHPARRAIFALQYRGGRTDVDHSGHQPMAPVTTDTVIVLEFQPGDVPVLVGYRLKEGVDPADRALVERFVGSVRVEAADD